MPANDVIPVYEWTANPESSSLFLIKISGNKEWAVNFYKACMHVSIEQAKRSTQDKSGFAALVDRVFVSATPW